MNLAITIGSGLVCLLMAIYMSKVSILGTHIVCPKCGWSHDPVAGDNECYNCHGSIAKEQDEYIKHKGGELLWGVLLLLGYVTLSLAFPASNLFTAAGNAFLGSQINHLLVYIWPVVFTLDLLWVLLSWVGAKGMGRKKDSV